MSFALYSQTWQPSPILDPFSVTHRYSREFSSHLSPEWLTFLSVVLVSAPDTSLVCCINVWTCPVFIPAFSFLVGFFYFNPVFSCDQFWWSKFSVFLIFSHLFNSLGTLVIYVMLAESLLFVSKTRPGGKFAQRSVKSQPLEFLSRCRRYL